MKIYYFLVSVEFDIRTHGPAEDLRCQPHAHKLYISRLYVVLCYAWTNFYVLRVLAVFLVHSRVQRRLHPLPVHFEKAPLKWSVPDALQQMRYIGKYKHLQLFF